MESEIDKVLKEIYFWNSIRNRIITGENELNKVLLDSFSPKVLELIKKDLKLQFFLREEDYKIEQLNYIFDIIMNNQTQTNNQIPSKYAKVLDFDISNENIKPKLIKVLSFKRIKGVEVGASYVDKWGFIYRLIFFNYETNIEQILDLSSFIFAKDFRNSGIKNGDDCLAFSMIVGHPKIENTYRRWIFQRVNLSN